MKYLVVIGDGMADNPVEALGGKTPLETALDSCVRAGVLDGWEYCGAKKAKLSDSEVDIGDYATFIGLYSSMLSSASGYCITYEQSRYRAMSSLN